MDEPENDDMSGVGIELRIFRSLRDGLQVQYKIDEED